MLKILEFFRNRRRRKKAREVLHHARYFRRMREDVMEAANVERLCRLEQDVRYWLKEGDIDAMETACRRLDDHLADISPAVSFASLRENLEIVAVAIAVAMGVRTYFLQPFKIPTGSMQPTLFGVHSTPRPEPALLDRLPLKLVKWVITGDWYFQVRAKTSGVFEGFTRHPTDPASLLCIIGPSRHKIPRDAAPNVLVRPRTFVSRGTLIWAGVRHSGDHVFVDKVRWNFRRPERGEIMVFDTEDIPSLPPNTHYIKRLSGMPDETVSIHPPNLVIDGKPAREPEQIRRIAEMRNGYQGYKLIGLEAEAESPVPLRFPGDRFPLGGDEYFALGDNTGNSKDSRYWGAVPRGNLVGPALLVYWPFGPRWGLAD